MEQGFWTCSIMIVATGPQNIDTWPLLNIHIHIYVIKSYKTTIRPKGSGVNA